MESTGNLREYGNPPYSIVVVHGGPGAPGDMKPVAKELSQTYGVLEPLQTADSIKGQIEELKRVIEQNTTPPIVLIGWSWGAWLTYLLAVQFPSLVKKLILISSGPFEEDYAKKIMPTRLSRLSPEGKKKVEALLQALQNNKGDDGILNEFGTLMDKADTFDPIETKSKPEFNFQPDIYKKVWGEAEQLRASGELIRISKRVKCPVVAVHGDDDPHPAEGVRQPLTHNLQNFRFILLKNCGHTPWMEKQAKDEFYRILSEELEN